MRTHPTLGIAGSIATDSTVAVPGSPSGTAQSGLIVELQPIVYTQSKQTEAVPATLLPEAYKAQTGSFLKYVGLCLLAIFVLAMIFAPVGSPLRPTVIFGTATGEIQGANQAAEAAGAALKAQALAQVEIDKYQRNLTSQLSYDTQKLELEKQAIAAKASADADAQIQIQQRIAAMETTKLELTAKLRMCGRLQAEISEYRSGIGVGLLGMVSPELRRAADIVAMQPKIDEYKRCKEDLARMAQNAGVPLETFER